MWLAAQIGRRLLMHIVALMVRRPQYLEMVARSKTLAHCPNFRASITLRWPPSSQMQTIPKTVRILPIPKLGRNSQYCRPLRQRVPSNRCHGTKQTPGCRRKPLHIPERCPGGLLLMILSGSTVEGFPSVTHLDTTAAVSSNARSNSENRSST